MRSFQLLPQVIDASIDPIKSIKHFLQLHSSSTQFHSVQSIYAESLKFPTRLKVDC